MGNDLARRVRENTNGTSAVAGTAVEKADRDNGAPSLGQQIQQMQQHFQLAMPRGVEAVQLIRDALTCLRTTKNLAKCEPQSVLGALMTCAQLGLRPGVLGHAWLLPFWDSRLAWADEKGRQRTGGYRAQLVIGYQGLIELAHRSGQIKSLVARTVRENDEFDVAYGIDDLLVHKPVMSGDRGAPIAYYAVVKFLSGGHAFFVMSHDEMETYRDRYAMARNKEGKIVGPWVDQFEGMALKTTIRQLAKWMPKATEFASAIEADGTVRVDVTPDPDALLHGEHPELVEGGAATPGADSSDGVEQSDSAPTRPQRESTDSMPAAADAKPVDEQPAAGDAPAESAKPAPTRTMMARLHALLSDCKVAEAERHATLGAIAGRAITSANDLTRDEASKVIDVLARCTQNGEPARALEYYLANVEQGDGE
ncbi:MAG TPA: recombination protein RecT [Mycobacterium sp.]|nr:recombination protein RecT [Mycobacterium sp.]